MWGFVCEENLNQIKTTTKVCEVWPWEPDSLVYFTNERNSHLHHHHLSLVSGKSSLNPAPLFTTKWQTCKTHKTNNFMFFHRMNRIASSLVHTKVGWSAMTATTFWVAFLLFWPSIVSWFQWFGIFNMDDILLTHLLHGKCAGTWWGGGGSGMSVQQTEADTDLCFRHRRC